MTLANSTKKKKRRKNILRIYYYYAHEHGALFAPTIESDQNYLNSTNEL